jgi:vacuolar-type H+-ATPase subunit E/Vma4
MGITDDIASNADNEAKKFQAKQKAKLQQAKDSNAAGPGS